MNQRRIARIEQQIKERVATLLIHDIADPRLGFVTVSRVQVDKELHSCKVFWSSLGGDKDRRLTQAALDHARGFVRREVAAILHTRTVPRIEFRFDESVEGAQKMQRLLDDLREERGDAPEPPPADGSPTP